MEHKNLIKNCQNSIDKEKLFNKCKINFWEIIKNNLYREALKEINYPLLNLQIIEHSISLKFSPNLEEIYFIDTKIIFATEDLIPLGHFRWVETNLNEFIDDFFVVY